MTTYSLVAASLLIAIPADALMSVLSIAPNLLAIDVKLPSSSDFVIVSESYVVSVNAMVFSYNSSAPVLDRYITQGTFTA